jgi:hypothetical protein
LSYAPTQAPSPPEQLTKSTPAKAASNKAAPKKEAAVKAPKPDKVFKDALKDINKTWNAVHKKYKPNARGVARPHFSCLASTLTPAFIHAFNPLADRTTFRSHLAPQFVPRVKDLSSGTPLHAFILLLDMADHCYGDLEACMKASGESGEWKSGWSF